MLCSFMDKKALESNDNITGLPEGVFLDFGYVKDPVRERPVLGVMSSYVEKILVFLYWQIVVNLIYVVFAAHLMEKEILNNFVWKMRRQL
jgi:hypothetical protein